MNGSKKSRNSSLHWMALALLIMAVLVLAGCGPRDQERAADEPPPTEATVAEATEAPDEEDTSATEETIAAATDVPVQQQLGGSWCSEEDVTTPRERLGGEYRDVATSDAVSFHPALTTDTASSGYQAMVYSGSLLRLDEETLEYIPNMAECYSISDDGLTFTFNLREGMLWSDGEPITAHDFKWTYDMMIDPANEFPYLSQLDFITSYEALDDYTLEITIDEVYAPALGQMSGLITPVPRHIWEDLDWGDPETNSEINSPSVVSGPYKLVEWNRDQYAIFEANENYWYRGRPNFDRYVIEIVPDQDVAYQKLKSSESDTGTILPENLEEAKSLDNVNVYEWWPAAARWEYIGLNMREGFPTHDINVRHGINYALDKELITEEVMLGQAKRLCGPFPETSWVYNPDIPCYAYDREQALAEFEEAGYTFDGEQMVDENGEQLTLRLLYGPNTSKTRELIAVVVQDYLGDIGINVEIQALEWASFLDATNADDPDWDIFIGGWRATIEPHIMYTIWAEDSIPELNSVAYINDEVQELFAEGGKTYDADVRKEKYGEAQRLIAEDAPYVFLYYSKGWSGQNERIQGIEPTALGIGWNSEDWYIEE